MLVIKPYHSFEEVKDEIGAKNPVVYKYRCWDNDLHKRIIREKEIWFSHPHDLNDQFDMRPPHRIIIDNIDWDLFREKLVESVQSFNQELNGSQIKEEIESRFQQAQKNPIAYFSKNVLDHQNERLNYDRIGVFSCCTSGLNRQMWEHYGDNLRGFAVGFKTSQLAEELNCTCGDVEYSDTPIDFDPMGGYGRFDGQIIFQKARKWYTEEEFRFSTARIGVGRTRNFNFSSKAPEEVLIGSMMPEDMKQTVIDDVKKNLPNIPIYEVVRAADGQTLTKQNIM